MNAKDITEEIVEKEGGVFLGMSGRIFINTFVSHLAVLAGTFILTILLNPAEYGVFVLIIALLRILSYITDIGISASLIQKKKVEKSELNTAFFIQILFSVIIASLILLIIPILSFVFQLSRNGIQIFWSLALYVLIITLKSPPLILMSRRLQFGRTGVLSLVESLTFYLLLVYLAWQGWGIVSLAWAVVARALVGVVLAYIFAPWLPTFHFDFSKIKTLLSFGLPYQLGSFLALLRDDGVILLLAPILGPTGLGLLGWAQKWTFIPMRAFAANIMQVAFPSFARLQTEKKILSEYSSRMVFSVHSLLLPTLVGLAIVAPWVIEILPGYTKWKPALPALFLFAASSLLFAHSVPFINLLNALGKAVIVTRIIAVWTAGTLILMFLLSSIFGVNGAAWGAVLSSLTVVTFDLFARRYIQLDFGDVFKPILATGVMAAAVLIVASLLPISALTVGFLVLIGVALYFTVLVILQ